MNLQDLRHKRKLTQRELAEKVGLATISIKKLESGASNPSYVTLQELSKALNYSINVISSAINNSKR